MRYVLLLLLLTTLSSSCLSKSSERIKRSVDRTSPVHVPLDLNKSAKNKTKFTDLNFDVLYLIFEQMDFNDIRNLGRVDAVLAPLANAVIRRKCRSFDMKVIIKEPTDIVIENIDRACVNITKMTIEEKFQLYGSLMKSISVRSVGIPASNLAVILGLIQKYCSEALTHLDLDVLRHDTFTQFTKPLEAVRSLSFEIHTWKLNTGNLSLAQLFPRLERLDVMIRCIMDDYQWLDHDFPHLQHLRIYATAPRHARVWDTRIESVIQRNQQLRSISLRGFPPGQVQMINQRLPELEELSLYALKIGNENVRFDHVTKFVLHDDSPDSLNRLTLPQLKSLEITYSPSSFNTWKSFLERHSTLTHLSLLSLNEQTVPLTELTRGLPHLTDVKYRSKYHIKVDVIHKFLESSPKLKKFEFTLLYYFKGDELMKFRQRYANQWHTRTIDAIWPSLLMERKIVA